ncbi:uncharacterized protein PV09_06031 [Verruconis gallopava]|uniref:RING-type domain-containing protein n=1 Tax=Verruconis gallopava TaxID=253628 RepID=A0A0D2A7R0_9PEZI|nr:uncharacterized protein PV09_06031 [Verruconis gallopava]KIW02580.1 hypothetical protein PV09_06031 [Verruconis gallopava]
MEQSDSKQGADNSPSPGAHRTCEVNMPVQQDQSRACDICLLSFDEYHVVNEERQPRLRRKEHPVTTPCGHTFGAMCLGHWLKSQQSCPMCRAPLTSAQILHDHTDPKLSVVFCEYEGMIPPSTLKLRGLYGRGCKKGSVFNLEGTQFVIPANGSQRRVLYNDDKSIVLISIVTDELSHAFELEGMTQRISLFPNAVTIDLLTNSELWALTNEALASRQIRINGRAFEVPPDTRAVALTLDGEVVRCVKFFEDWVRKPAQTGQAM